MNTTIATAVLAAALLCGAAPAAAYVGPGAGLSALGAVWGLVAALGTALAFVLLWPIRALVRRLRGRKATPAEPGATPPAEPRK